MLFKKIPKQSISNIISIVNKFLFHIYVDSNTIFNKMVIIVLTYKRRIINLIQVFNTNNH
jgi:hypothetical protein